MKTSTRIASVVTLIVAASVSTGCFSYRILETPYISMTEDGPPSSAAKATGPASGRYCVGDPPANKKSSVIGLIDEATIKAQKASKADYIQNAIFVKDGGLFKKVCVSVTGKALKGKATGGKSKG